MDAASEAAELEQKIPVPVPVNAEAKPSMNDGHEVESHTAARETGSDNAPGGNDAGNGDKGGRIDNAELMKVLLATGEPMDKLEETNPKLEMSLADNKKNDLRVNTFMTPPRKPPSIKYQTYLFPTCSAFTLHIKRKQEQHMDFLQFIHPHKVKADVSMKQKDSKESRTPTRAR
ncbi:hypothetical protein PHMEG_00019775 [Phytophthora megakarya]|uniref:Uncharacterized protein n=1 Tax=Phytophthora megakarya TaxID=4795 RepID=A0A225VR63_9STRA|nr:hypothetical protein PHMEG_00019775 [Phytophthora megakarya]